ncbi:hypothetical protein SAMN04488550_3303 [Gordonia malaquae]|uniref:DUF6542 domain-containing protein n=1 Tax=Gordonia malaquae NBRC 108250 TaxID=1223542 RepID=M3V9G4_GORML|nr:DUF6542 domain-containing protein [Gordonia malaquae]GAC77913.1 hypothetical protein GM1_001_00370 [Gordonia malaquae NBRC 108250]SED84546.1 hypothetical protein SAMN04488550_3303 [Gordonia malaquae]
MFPRSLAGSALPADQQSVIPSVRGLPWWGAVLVATSFTVVGAVISADSTPPLGRVFKVFLVVGVVLAALAVRRRALFTAAVQPPLIAFIVGIVALFSQHEGGTDKKTIILKVVLPIATAFPWMVIAFVAALLVVLVRLFFTGPESKRPFGGVEGLKKRLAGGKAAKPAPAKRKPTTDRTSTTKAREDSRPQKPGRAPRSAAPSERVPAKAAAKPAPQPQRRRPTPKPAPAERTRATPQKIPASQRRTAGQQLRERGQIEDLAAGLDD